MFGQNLDHSVKDTYSSCLHVKAWATDAFKIHIFKYNKVLTRITAVFTADTLKRSDCSHCLFVHISFQSLFILMKRYKGKSQISKHNCTLHASYEMRSMI